MAAGTVTELSTDINRVVDVDTGSLLATDTSPLDRGGLRAKKDQCLLKLTRECAQALFNEIWKLPMERPDESIVAVLPRPTTILPREKPIPKPKPPTKWEMFAKNKGIKKSKRSRMLYDQMSGDYKPRWGYKRVKDPKDDWLIEVPENADINEDQFAKKDQERKEKIAKNEYQRLRNIARNRKGKLKTKVPAELPSQKPTKEELILNLSRTKLSTASVGKFTEKLPKEPQPKKTGKKRKFDALIGNASREKTEMLHVLEGLAKKKPAINITKAVNKQLAEEQSKKAKTKGKQSGKQSKRFTQKTKQKQSSKQIKQSTRSKVKGKWKKQ